MEFHYPPGSTPLDANEIQGLKPKYISTQGELDALEQKNILECKAWLFGRTHRDIFSDEFIKKIHKKMFKDVWKWAGDYRTTNKSIGVSPFEIGAELRKLSGDIEYWLANGTYSNDEAAARFHHRLVLIHPFSNGNGRHSRLLTDVVLKSRNEPLFTWGGGIVDELGKTGNLRTRYIRALQEADSGNYESLLHFVRL